MKDQGRAHRHRRNGGQRPHAWQPNRCRFRRSTFTSAARMGKHLPGGALRAAARATAAAGEDSHRVGRLPNRPCLASRPWRSDLRLSSGAAFRRLPDRRIRAAGRGHGGRGDVQRHRVPGLAAHQRDRHPYGAGREPRGHRPHGNGHDHGLGRRWVGLRPGAGTGHPEHGPFAFERHGRRDRRGCTPRFWCSSSW